MTPRIVPKVWGGRALATRYGKTLPPEIPCGESWEVADLPEGSCAVACGRFAGRTLTSLRQEFGVRLTGTNGPFPLLVKVLDAHADLSVQVHPGAADLEGLGPGARSKDESWLILGATPGAAVYHGLHPEADLEEVLAVARDGDPMPWLRRVEVRPGDVLRVAPGTIHAIGAGVSLLEIQEPSDTTYRVYDYGRPGMDGAPRPLHLGPAERVLRAAQSPGPALLAPEGDVLVDVDAYHIERCVPRVGDVWRVERAEVVFCLDGAWSARGADDEAPVSMRRYETAVLPASMGEVEVVEVAPGTELIRAWVT